MSATQEKTAVDAVPTQLFIGGEWRDASGGATLSVEDPSTGESIAEVADATPEDAKAALDACCAVQEEWAAHPPRERGEILRRAFEAMTANADDLALVMTLEMGKPLAESKAEITYAAEFLRWFSEEAVRIEGRFATAPNGVGRLITMKQPVGPCYAITPWNFPAAMITRKAAPALAAGCTVVLKPAGETPLTALALAELADRAGIPKGVFNVVTGDSKAIGGVLTSHPAIRLVNFTGSTEIGKLLMRQAAGTVKKVALELGGNAPFIVFDDADLDAAVEGAMVSKFRNMGQTCVCANRIYAQSGIYDAFVEKLTAAVAKLQVGNGAATGTTQGPLINENAIAKVEQHLSDALAKGGRILLGGKRHALGGSFFEPTVLADANRDMILAREETFGPVAPVFRFETEAEVIHAANDTEFGLAAYFYTRDIGRIFRVGEGLEYGMVGINSGLISTELAPFGGVKESGNGREGSHHGIEEFVEKKYLLVAGLDR